MYLTEYTLDLIYSGQITLQMQGTLMMASTGISLVVSIVIESAKGGLI
jgi:hypothetical protein